MSFKKYLITVLDGMAKGLFASLIIGVIIKQIGVITSIKQLVIFGQIAQYFMGACVGCAIATSLKSKSYTLFSCIIAGAIGAGTFKYTEDLLFTPTVGEPIGALITSCLAVFIGFKIEGKTKFDLMIVPGTILLASILIGTFVTPPIAIFMNSIGNLLTELTTLKPMLMGTMLGIVVGMILTLPISSAALCIAININGLAAGAALAGCAAQMIGFAFMTFRVNKFHGLISQGIGTSMVQVPNIIKNPWIWLPPTIASGVCGFLSVIVFKIKTTSVGAGMGTSGLVGQFATISVMGNSALIPIIILHFIIPAIISTVFFEMLVKIKKIKLEDVLL